MIHIEKVTNRKGLLKFIQFRYDLYKDDPNDVPYLFFDEVNTLDKRKNASFEQCEADYFIAYKDGKAVGRVAAIINFDANKRWEKKVVRYGWFDFIDDLEVSEALLKTVEEWGRERGMTKMTGPMGFADTDREGMLIEGFEEYGTMYASYNYPYYPRHMEQMGFQKDNDYVQCRVKVPEKVPEKMVKISEMIMKRYHLHVRKPTKKEVMEEGLGHQMFHLINETFKDLYGYSRLSENQIDQYVKMYFPMVDLNLIPIIEDWSTEEHKMVGVGITIPSVSRAFQKCRRGRLLPFGWWHVLRALKFHKTDIVDLMMIGVLPEYRSKGVNALMFYDLIPWYNKYGIKWGESQVEMETNENVQGQWSYFDTTLHKRRRCFKKIIKG